MLLSSLNISTRLFVGFGMAILCGALLLVASIASQRMGTAAMQEASNQSKDLLARTAALKANLLTSAIATRNMGLASDLKQAIAQQEKAEASLKDYVAGITALKSMLVDEQSQQLLSKLERLQKDTQAQFVEAVGLLAALSTEEAIKVIAQGIDPKQGEALESLAGLMTHVEEQAEASIAQARDAQSRITWLISIVGAGSIALLAAFAYMVARSISVPVSTARDAVERIAAGDLMHRLGTEGKDEVSQLLRGIDAMRQALASMVSSMRGGAEVVAQATVEIVSGNNDLSRRTELQSASLQETTAAMQQLDEALRDTAAGASKASAQAQGTSEQAQQGGQMVDEAVSTMRRIQENARRIADITGVIDGIAFQTNILALNAAVEAARAGDHGRGFAVVASEVRGLAQRSAQAAKEIRTLIETSNSNVDAGTALVENAGKAMVEIVSSIRAVSALAESIRTATGEQSSNVSRVGSAMKSLEDMTQQSAAMVEQSAAAAGSLRDQTDRLLSSVAAFRLTNA